MSSRLLFERTTLEEGVSRMTRQGLQVVMHQAVIGGRFSCHENECASVKFMDGMTEIEQFGGADVDLIRRLHLQNRAHDAVEEMRRRAAEPEHNPFINEAARSELLQLASSHLQDPWLAPMAPQEP